MSLAVSARQSYSLIGVVKLDPFSGNTQSSLGVTGRAIILNLPYNLKYANVSGQLLFVESGNPLDQGKGTPCNMRGNDHAHVLNETKRMSHCERPLCS